LLVFFLISLLLYNNAQDNLDKYSIGSGFDFLALEAGFDITESMLDYDAESSYLKALFVGSLNTLKVAFIGNIFALLIGLFVGLAKLSSSWLLRKQASIYIESLRNIPLLLQLFLWYAVITNLFPYPKDALHPISHVFLSNRGIHLPLLMIPVYGRMIVAFIFALVCIFFLGRWARKKQELLGEPFPLLFTSLGLAFGFPLLVWLLSGMPFSWNIPYIEGFNFLGGYTLSPEFTALLLGLVFYTSSFNAEIVRSGINSVNRSQKEAAASLGLRPNLTTRLIILPQALRVMLPPLTSQVLNLTKNSSLAIAIGYSDFVKVSNTMINQTGQAIEGLFLIMGFYLIINIVTSYFMNLYNKTVIIK